MANGWGEEDDLLSTVIRKTRTSRDQLLVELFRNSTKSTLIADIDAVAVKLGISYRDSLLYADQYYRGNRTDSLVVLETTTSTAVTKWEATLGKATRTINRPDRLMLQYSGLSNDVSIESSKTLLTAVRKLGARILGHTDGSGFRATRAFLDETFLLTNFCLMCGRNSGMGAIPELNDGTIGMLWYDTHLPATLAAVRAHLHSTGFVTPDYVDSTSQVAGVCSRCRIKCNRCSGGINLAFDPIETIAMQQEGVCRACAKQNLAMVEAPKFGRKDLRKLNSNLIRLKGGNAE